MRRDEEKREERGEEMRRRERRKRKNPCLFVKVPQSLAYTPRLVTGGEVETRVKEARRHVS